MVWRSLHLHFITGGNKCFFQTKKLRGWSLLEARLYGFVLFLHSAAKNGWLCLDWGGLLLSIFLIFCFCDIWWLMVLVVGGMSILFLPSC